MSNVEVMYSVYFIKMIERSGSTLRHSIFDILRFAFSIREVSYKRLRANLSLNAAQQPDLSTRNS